MVSRGEVSMGPGLVLLVDAMELGLALSGAVGDEVGESKDTNESVGDMLACFDCGLDCWVRC